MDIKNGPSSVTPKITLLFLRIATLHMAFTNFLILKNSLILSVRVTLLTHGNLVIGMSIIKSESVLSTDSWKSLVKTEMEFWVQCFTNLDKTIDGPFRMGGK